MVVKITLLVVALVIAAIWIFIEVKRLKHKLFAIFLIGLILFSYISFTVTIKGKNIDLKTVPGMIEAGKLYFIWLSSAFSNMKTITTNAINMDWRVNETTHPK